MARVYVNRQLVYLSIISFFYFSSIGSIAPFLTMHMRHLGFSLPEVSFINAVAAFVSLLGPLLGGTIAEKYRCYKGVSVVSVFLGAIAFSAIAFVPRSERLPYRPLVDFSCRSGLRIERCANWGSCHGGLTEDNLTTVQLSQCHYRCAKKGEVSTAHPMHICFHGESGNICVVYDTEGGNMSTIEFDTQLSSWPFDEEPEKSEVNATERISLAALDIFEPLWLEAEKDAKSELHRANVAMCNYHPKAPISLNQKSYNSISCRPNFEDCDIQCKASFTSGGHPVVPNLCEEANGDPLITFWSYLILRSIGDMCLLTAVCLIDALIVSHTLDFEGAYGRMHVWPALGLSAFAPFGGALLDHYTDMEGKSNFSPPAFVSAGLAVLTCALLIIILPVPHKSSSPQFQCLPSGARTKKSLTFELFAFVVVVLVLGMQWGVIFTFLPLLTMEVGCTGLQTGMGYTFIFGCCLPFLLISKNLVRNIGRANLLVFALLFYGTRYAGVSYVLSPWWTLPFAAMGSFTLCVMWVAAVAYGQSLVPNGYHIIMQYILNMLHFGIGRGIGSILGGTLISHHGQRVTFRAVAIFSTIIGFLYLAVYHLGIRRRKQIKKTAVSVAANGSWYPLTQQPNGNTKVHNSMLADQDDDSDILANNAE